MVILIEVPFLILQLGVNRLPFLFFIFLIPAIFLLNPFSVPLAFSAESTALLFCAAVSLVLWIVARPGKLQVQRRERNFLAEIEEFLFLLPRLLFSIIMLPFRMYKLAVRGWEFGVEEVRYRSGFVHFLTVDERFLALRAIFAQKNYSDRFCSDGWYPDSLLEEIFATNWTWSEADYGIRTGKVRGTRRGITAGVAMTVAAIAEQYSKENPYQSLELPLEQILSEGEMQAIVERRAVQKTKKQQPEPKKQEEKNDTSSHHNEEKAWGVGLGLGLDELD